MAGNEKPKIVTIEKMRKAKDFLCNPFQRKTGVSQQIENLPVLK
jgi:hypothetical protein